MDFPHMDWPTAEWPKLKYPLSEFDTENRQEEDRCLTMVGRVFNIISCRNLNVNPVRYTQVESLMADHKIQGRDVAGIIAEPIQAEGGDHYATPYFFKGLQRLCHKVGLYQGHQRHQH